MHPTAPPSPDRHAALPEALARALEARGITSLTAVQHRVLDADSQGRDLRISSQTGSGKTLALGIALARDLDPDGGATRGPRALVIVPTRELANQVQGELHWLYAHRADLRPEVVTGGTPILPEVRRLARRPGVVVGTPGRLLDHVRSGALRCADVGHVVLDEADRMLEMGFKDELDAIVDALPVSRRSHLVSATFPAALRVLADRFQSDPLHLQGTRLGEANRDIAHVAHVVGPRATYAAIVNLLLLARRQRTLVFVERRADANVLAERLEGDGFPALPFSGELPQAQRTRTLEAFRRGRVPVLVATDVAARGIDVPGIAVVLHADLPADADVYVHRSGRTGRAGETGRSILLVPPRAERRMRRLLREARIEADWRPVPGPKKVRKTLAAEARRALAAHLEPDPEPTERSRKTADALLDGRDPTRVLAQVLDALQPEPPCAPQEVAAAEEPVRAARPARAEPETPPAGFVRFEIDKGRRDGATAARILAHVCRRGGIRGERVGAIRIGHARSSFDIAVEDADRFERRVRKQSASEEGTRIARQDRRR